MYNIHSLFLLYVKHHGGITNRLVPPAAVKILLLLLISRWSGGSNQSIWVTVRPALLKIEPRHLIEMISHHQLNRINHLSQTLFLVSMHCLCFNTTITITFDSDHTISIPHLSKRLFLPQCPTASASTHLSPSLLTIKLSHYQTIKLSNYHTIKTLSQSYQSPF